MTSSADRTVRERRAARRAALRAVHPDLGGDTEAFIDVMRAFEQSHPAGVGAGSGTTPETATGVAPGVGAAAAGPGAGCARPATSTVTVTTTLRSRTSRRARRARRRLRALAGRHRPASWPARHYTYLSEERA
ncbi:hypothetical protein ACNKF0_15145 [Nocardioides sp. T5]|uniref:hypothetical protein n=1 Tax=Nocardioides sp. T5 TaxID=3400182 RepID=UPI003A8BF328